MNKLFIIFILLLKIQCFANEHSYSYKEPRSEEIKNQEKNISKIFSQAEDLTKDKKFKQQLAIERVNELPHSYQEPTNTQITDQKENISHLFSQAEDLTNDKNFKQQLDLERAYLSLTNIGTGHNYEIPQFISKERELNYLSNIPSNINFEENKQESLIVFITLSMPTKELKLLIDECSKIGASIFIRGFYKDLKTTISKVQELSSENGISIDPTLFKKYQVNQVPTFILPLSKKGSSQQEYVKASGSVTLSYFLDLVIRTGKKEEVLLAKSWRSKL